MSHLFKSAFTFISAFILLSISVTSHAQDNDDLVTQDDYRNHAQQVWNTIEPEFGQVKLPNAVATLNIPSDFYYINPEDAEKVLTQIWGNPPGQNTLGMLLPAGKTPLDSDTWAVSIQYEEDGYVSDEDASEIDYSELLTGMQDEVNAASASRVKQGYGSIELLGWASQPFYDQASHKMHWAKELKFGQSDQHTLNYNIRVLGRKGVLVLNFIASMDQKYLIESKLDKVLAIADFDQGSQYSDFDPELDEIAAYGLGALVAGKVIAKTGFLVAALIFLKKFGVIFLLAGAALLKRLFNRNKNKQNNT
ncbi:MAG: DUF2167 domain-containing protein [Bermanella sp.]